MSPAFSEAAGGPEKWASLRPEKIGILPARAKPSPGQQGASAKIIAAHYQGSVTRFNTRTANGEVINVTVPSSLGKFAEGDEIMLHWPKEALHIMAGEA